MYHCLYSSPSKAQCFCIELFIPFNLCKFLAKCLTTTKCRYVLSNLVIPTTLFKVLKHEFKSMGKCKEMCGGGGTYCWSSGWWIPPTSHDQVQLLGSTFFFFFFSFTAIMKSINILSWLMQYLWNCKRLLLTKACLSYEKIRYVVLAREKTAPWNVRFECLKITLQVNVKQARNKSAQSIKNGALNVLMTCYHCFGAWSLPSKPTLSAPR